MPTPSQPIAPPPKRVFAGVQALRFWAAFVVVVEHATFYVHERLDDSVPVWEFGRLGVFVFFVISGFVMQLSVDKSPAARSFAYRRIVRIVPLYWIATSAKLLTLAFAPALVLHAVLSPVTVGLSYVFLPTTNVDGMAQPLLGVGWTLVFEAMFYVLVTVALACRVSPFWTVSAFFVMLSFGHVARGDDFAAVMVYFDPIVLFFVSGMALARLIARRRLAEFLVVQASITAIWVIVWTATAAPGNVSDVRRIIGAMVVVGIVVVVVIGEPMLRGWIPRCMQFLGDASYSIYLTHSLAAPVVPVFFAAVGLRSGTAVVSCLIVTVVVGVLAGALVYVLVERPIGRYLRSRPFPRRLRARVGSRSLERM